MSLFGLFTEHGEKVRYSSAGKTPKVTSPASLILVTTSCLSRAPPSFNLYTPDVHSPWDHALLGRLTWKSAGRFRQKQSESHVKTEWPSPPSPLRGHRRLAHPILKVPVWGHNCSVRWWLLCLGDSPLQQICSDQSPNVICPNEEPIPFPLSLWPFRSPVIECLLTLV